MNLEQSRLTWATSGHRPNEAANFGRDSGRIVGLVLGPGGIRGCAHAGILAALHDFDVSADIVVGASIGAVFGAVYAAGWGEDRINHLVDAAPQWAVAQFYLGRLNRSSPHIE